MWSKTTLLAGLWTRSNKGVFKVPDASNPELMLEGEFTPASLEQIEAATSAGALAYSQLLTISLDQRSKFLEALAVDLLEFEDRIVERCAAESGLSLSERLRTEFRRTIDVILDFATRLKNGYIVDVHLLSEMPDRTPRRRPDLRSKRIGIGPVVVLEASNFPLSFGAAGGDVISALAAGCPVIVKAQKWHAGTSTLVAHSIDRARIKTAMPSGIYSLLHGGNEEAALLVADERVRGVGVTGSRASGDAIRKITTERARPLDTLSLEMGSVNPVILLPKAFKSRAEHIATALAAAVFNGSGQFCTKPGVVFLPAYCEAAYSIFTKSLCKQFVKQSPFQMLGSKFVEEYWWRLSALGVIDGVESLALGAANPRAAQAALLSATFDAFVTEPILRDEIFGPATILVPCKSETQLLCAASYFEGELTASIHFMHEELKLAEPVLRQLETRVGRIVANGFGPGAEVCDSINHGGPWPSALTNYTVIGPSSVRRWLRGICYQDMPDGLLCAELADRPLPGFQRTRDGVFGSH